MMYVIFISMSKIYIYWVTEKLEFVTMYHWDERDFTCIVFFFKSVIWEMHIKHNFLGDFWAAFDTKHDPTCCSRLFETIYHWRRQMKYHINNIFALDHYALIIHVEFLAGNLIYKRGWFIHGKGFYIGFGPELRWKGLLYTFSFKALGLW